MKINEIQGMTGKQIQEKLNELRKELIKLNAQAATGSTPQKPSLLRTTKKTIAKLLKVQSQQSKEEMK
ncbi:50S ribosomal protein L29 [Candidatus Woesearchaeota archaeon]|jgi:ribosomal protein L29|nr:50S ribosomal protein L29 [Candidatus Woesearchaeota archaeon]